MKKPLLLVLALLLVAGSILAVVLELRARAYARAHPPAKSANPHAAGIDREMTALRAMYEAPLGETPCETAYNAFFAADEAARSKKQVPLVLRLAPRDEFLARCNALPAGAQPCLAPAYSMRHREECVKSRPSGELLKPMFEIKPMEGVHAGEQDADRQFQSTGRR